MREVYGEGRDFRGLLGGLGKHGVAGSDGGCDLAHEDGEREIPRADAEHGADRRRVEGEVGAGARGVVAAEIHGLTKFADGVAKRLAGLVDEQGQQRRAVFFECVGPGFEQPGALGDGGRECRLCHRPVGVGDGCVLGGRRVRQGDLLREHGQGGLVGEIEALGVAPARQQVGGQGDAAVAGAGGGAGAGNGVGHELVEIDGGVDDLVDEGAVGAVFQQAAHEIGEQRLVRADRGVDAAGAAGDVAAGVDDAVIDRLAHAVQALELVVGVAADGFDGGDGERVVGGELGEDRVRRGKHRTGAGNVRNIGVGLAGEDRVVPQAEHLGGLDLAVPIGALDQADHQAVTAAAAEIGEPVDHCSGTFLICLHNKADAVPAGEGGVECQGFEEVEREVEPVAFLGVDVEADVLGLGEQEQIADSGQQLRHHAAALGAGVAWVEGGELD